ncbi:MAG: IucA/IucC family C-terminal-domain containing protein, partial [Micromonosporaceae bacterium]
TSPYPRAPPGRIARIRYMPASNFFRTNPVEHAHRAADASALIAALRTGWTHGGFDVLVETGYRTVSHPTLAEDLTVVFRENPFTDGRYAPLVLAALLEERPGGEPDLMAYLREAGGGSVTGPVVERWLRRYLAISLVPALQLWSTSGVSLEAHAQNSLVHLDGGWPDRLWVRDMEGVSVSRQRLTRPDLLAPDSPVLYDDAEAWHRLRYYLVTNHLGHLLHVLGRHGGVPERGLWAIVGEVLAGLPGTYPDRLRHGPTLPAKANLTSRFTERGERPSYVDIPNPIREVSR